MNGKDIALVAAAGVIAYLIYLYEKKKTAVASQITGYEATATQPGTSIPALPTVPNNSIDAIFNNPIIGSPSPNEAQAAAGSITGTIGGYLPPLTLDSLNQGLLAGQYGSYVPGYPGAQ